MKKYSWLNNILEQDIEPFTDKQKAIVIAAVELFSEKGYAATSTKEIAKKAGVAEGTIFRQYPTKKDLMLWITERIIQTTLLPFISSGISELLAKPFDNREEFLSAFILNRLALVREGAPLIKIILQELPFQPEIRSMLINQFKTLPLEKIADKLLQGESTSFSKTDVMQTLIPSIAGFFLLRNIIMPEFFPKNRTQKDTETFIRFINQGFYSKGEKQ